VCLCTPTEINKNNTFGRATHTLPSKGKKHTQRERKIERGETEREIRVKCQNRKEQQKPQST